MLNVLYLRLLFLSVLLIGSNIVLAQHFSVKGKVLNENQIGLANASVQILNSNYSTQTDASGDFIFQNVKEGSYIIRISSIGYASENRTVEVNRGVKIEVQLTQVSSRLDDAVVTAYKEENDPQKIAASLSILNETDIKDHLVWNIKDVTAMVPNLTMANPGDNRNLTSIRGISTSSYDPAVVTYVDGVSQFNLDTYIPYLQDVERVEVLRGPQGSLYGRNAMGGVINIITKKPTNEQTGFVEANFGNHGQQRYLAGFRSPLIQDKLFLGASGLFNKLDGFYTNDFNDSHYDKQHTSYGNVFLKYLPSETWAMTLNVKKVANRNNGTFPVVRIEDEPWKKPFHLSQNALTKMIDNSMNTSLSVNHYGDAISFSSQIAYQTNQRYYKDPIDSDFSPMDIVSLINNYGKEWNQVKVFTQELKLSSPVNNSSPFNWTGGLYFFHQDKPEKQGMYYGDDAGLWGVPFTDVTSILSNSMKSNGLAFFGQVGYKLGANLHALAGLRYDYEDQKRTGKEEFMTSDGSIVVLQPDTSGSANFHAFTPSASLRYDLTDDNSVYGSYSRGFRAGGLSPVTSAEDEPSLRSFDPEYSNNFEIGSKNVFFDNRLRLNVVAFYTRINDAQVPTFVLPDAITLTRNTGRMNSKGIEVELNAKLLSALDVYSNFGYTHARYSDLNLQQQDENEQKENVQLKGNRPISTPDWTSMVGAKYTYSFGTRLPQSIQINGYAKFLGKQYFDLSNTIDQKAYSLLNANISYETSGYSVMIWGQNLGNTTYLDYAYDFGAVHFGNPVTYGVTLRKTFGR